MQPKERVSYDTTFQHDLSKSEEAYNVLLQCAQYTDFNLIPEDIIKVIPPQDEIEPLVFFYYAYLQPDESDLMEKLFLKLIKTFQDEYFSRNLTVGFVIVYFNHMCHGVSGYNHFRMMLKSLPSKYLCNLKKIVIVQSGILVRGQNIFTQGRLNKFLKNVTYACRSLTELKTLLPCIAYLLEQPQQLIKILPLEIYEAQFPDKQSKKQISRARYNYSAHQFNKKTSDINLDMILFGQLKIQSIRKNEPPGLLLNKQGIVQKPPSLTDYQLTEYQVPVVLQVLLDWFKQRPNELKIEGIFRKAADIQKERQVLDKLTLRQYSCLQTIEDRHIVASLIKKFLTRLEPPVFSYQLYEVLTNSPSVSGQALVYLVKSILGKLSVPNYNTLMTLLMFFIDYVLPHYQENKMQNYNIAVVLAPCLLRSKVATLQDLKFTSTMINVIKLLLESFQQFFGKREKIQEAIEKAEAECEQSFKSSVLLNNRYIGSQTETKKETVENKQQLEIKNKQPNTLASQCQYPSVLMENVSAFSVEEKEPDYPVFARNSISMQAYENNDHYPDIPFQFKNQLHDQKQKPQ